MERHTCIDCDEEFLSAEPADRCLTHRMRPAPKIAESVKQAQAKLEPAPARIKDTGEGVDKQSAAQRQAYAYAKYTAKHKNDDFVCPVCGWKGKGFYCAPCRTKRSRAWRLARKNPKQ